MTDDTTVSPLPMVSILLALETARGLQKTPTPREASEQKLPASGLLAQPMTIHIGHLLGRGKPQWYRGTDESWAEHVELISGRERQEWRDRLIDLARWYGIELYTDPDPSDEWHRLVFALARDFVPCFAVSHDLGAKLPGRGAPPVLGVYQTICLARCVYGALTTGTHSDGTIARLALEKVDLKVPSRGRGPRKRGHSGSRPLPRQTATHLVKEMRRAWADVLKGTASAFQFLVVSLAILPEQDFILVPDWGIIFGLRQPNNQAD